MSVSESFESGVDVDKYSRALLYFGVLFVSLSACSAQKGTDVKPASDKPNARVGEIDFPIDEAELIKSINATVRDWDGELSFDGRLIRPDSGSEVSIELSRQEKPGEGVPGTSVSSLIMSDLGLGNVLDILADSDYLEVVEGPQNGKAVVALKQPYGQVFSSPPDLPEGQSGWILARYPNISLISDSVSRVTGDAASDCERGVKYTFKATLHVQEGFVSEQTLTDKTGTFDVCFRTIGWEGLRGDYTLQGLE